MIAGVGNRRSSRGAAHNGRVGPAGLGKRWCACGFTLIELVMVMVVVAVLAVFVAPRLVSLADFNARGFHDETASLLRFAQKSAIAQRRPVCVVFAAAGATLRIDADRNSATGSAGCEADLTGPRGESPGSLAARGSVQYTTTPATVVFDGLGSPGAGVVITVAGAGRSITVEAATGYVHE